MLMMGYAHLQRKDTPEGVVAYTYIKDAVATIKGYRRSAVQATLGFEP